MKYDLILADPPWKQGKGGKKNVREKSSGGELDYNTMDFVEIESLLKKLFSQLSDTNTNFFVWTIDKYLTETDLMLTGFGYKRHARIVWDKITGIPAAFTVRYSHEYLLWYYSGKFQPIAESEQGKFTTVFREQTKKHSKKPQCIYTFLEKIYPEASKIELFARPDMPLFPVREGWDVWGNEVNEHNRLSLAI